jgi:hypothetical protein
MPLQQERGIMLENMPVILHVLLLCFWIIKIYKNGTINYRITTDGCQRVTFFFVSNAIRRFEEKAAEQYTAKTRGFPFVHWRRS